MGIDFRDGRYTRRVKMGKRTVKEGEAVAIWDRQGRHRQVIGPQLVFLFYSTIRFLDRHIVNENQYVRLENRDGSIEHRRGPCVVWENPVFHRKVETFDAIELLSTRDCIVILQETPSKLVKTAVFGPARYFLKPQEQLLEYTWSGDGIQDGLNLKKKTILQVQNARFEPTVMFPEDVLVTFSLIYSVLDPIHLVNNTTNLTGQMLDTIRADAISVDSERLQDARNTTPEQMKTVLPRLHDLCERMQVNLQEITVVNVQLSRDVRSAQESKKKALADLDASEESAKLKIRLANLELDGARDRAEKRNELARHELENTIALQKRQHEAALELRAQKVQETIGFLQQLKSLDVDVSRFVCEAVQNGKASRSGIAEGQTGLIRQIAWEVASGFAQAETND